MVDESIRFIRTLKGKKSNAIKTIAFENHVKILREEAFLNGLSDANINIIVDVIMNTDLSVLKHEDLFLCLVPVNLVPEEVAVKVIYWILTYFDTVMVTKIICALNWLIGLIKYDLVKTDLLNTLYETYFHLLKSEKLAPYACHLLYLLTRQDDVSKWRVTRLLNQCAKAENPKYLTSLLCRYKSYKPESVPHKLLIMNVTHAFPKIPEKLITRFEGVKERQTHQQLESRDCGLMWNINLSSRRNARRIQTDLIPGIEYIQFQSTLYRKEKYYPVYQFHRLKDLMDKFSSLKLPCQITSLLGTDQGHFLLAHLNSHEQDRFSYVLYSKLCGAFLDQVDPKVTREEKEAFLRQIVALQNYIQQGIPVVSKFLAQYLPMWNGVDYSPYIFQLMERINFCTYTELYDCILDKLYNMFMSSPLPSRCLIISSLTALLKNVVTTDVFREKHQLPTLFLSVGKKWDTQETLIKLATFVQDLCIMGLIVENGSIVFFHEVLNFYDLILRCRDFGHLVCTLEIPSVVFYHGLFSMDGMILSRTCSLLHWYAVRCSLYAMKQSENSLNQSLFRKKELLQAILTDFAITLLEGRAFMNKTGSIFRTIFVEMPHPRYLDVPLSQAFQINNHLALAPYFAVSQPRKTPLTKETALQVAKENLTGLSELMKYLATRSQPGRQPRNISF